MIEIEKPKLQEAHFKEALKCLKDNHSFFEEMQKMQNPTYKRWENVKYNTKFKPEILWSAGKFLRQTSSQDLPFEAETGIPFKFWELPRYRRFFSEFDALTRGKDFSIDHPHQKIFIQNGILEEAIQSSRLEGAVTSRRDAQQLIRSSRKPKDKSEQMILNNYQTIQKIQSEWKDQSLSLDLLFEIHFSITHQTDLEQNDTFRLRKNSDKVNVVDSVTNEVAHHCPDEEFLKTKIEKLILFANDKLDDDNYVFWHPLTKAIILHFWIGYLHPFVDGNGRTARAIFYWYLLRNGYWAIPFIPISNKIITAKAQYRDALLLTEQDDLDFNYFFDFHIQKLQLSMNDFYKELEKLKSLKSNETVLLQANFNPRQIALLQYFWQNPSSSTTFKIHENFHRIHSLTSRKDLKELETKKLLLPKNSGKTIYFYPDEDAINRLFEGK